MSAVAEGGVYQEVLSGLEGLSSCFTYRQNSCTCACAKILKAVNFAAILAIISEKEGRSEEILKALRKVNDLQKRSDPASNCLFSLISIFSKITGRIFGKTPKSSEIIDL